ncbi:MAG TPA: PIN domain-containing protein [Nitrososphaerales archaeon]|nr:PIN domain-containing protein [Nitrososphaerales archaeon]
MLFDTRYFWTLFNEKDVEFLGKLHQIYERSKRPLISSVSIYEIQKLSIETEGEIVAELRVNTMKRDFEVIDVDSPIAEEGARIAHVHRTPMADSLIMATAKELKLPCVTDDPHFRPIRTVWV